MYNLLTEPIGTPDGIAVTGSKAYYETGPTATSYNAPYDTGTISVANADGRQRFTGVDQPYHLYNQILLPGDSTPLKRWELKIPRSVNTFAFTLRVFAAVPSEPGVPALAPDTVPSTLYDSTNILMHSPYFPMSSRVLKDIASVRFQEGTTHEERQAAISLVKGTVVGGQPFPGMEGYYLVRVQDSGTGQQLRAAVDRLSSLPQIATADGEYLWLPEDFALSAQPEDSGDWGKPWQTTAALASGDNWALESISAPRAWACTTGSPLTKVAVVDFGFHSQPDLVENTTYAPAMDVHAGWLHVKNDHGTAVASLIGARGNNGTGITGTMWAANLSLYDIATDMEGNALTQPYYLVLRRPAPILKIFEYRLLQAVNSGASIINVSLGLPKTGYTEAHTPPNAQTAKDVQAAARALSRILTQSSNKPLVVIGAGNDSWDAYWSLYPVLAALVPDQVLVVAGVRKPTEFQAALWVGSNYNTADPLVPYNLVQIAAPGENVGMLGKNGVIVKSGTSMAAPLVAGAAGLLKSFDPRLTAPEMKALLLAGAAKAQRRVDNEGVYVVDAYETLKLAADRPGAPMCGGTPVWQDASGQVLMRKINSDNGILAPQTALFSHSGTTLIPMHGVPAIRTDNNVFGWTPTTWTPLSPAPADNFGNATNRSKLGYSHEGDSVVTVTRTDVSDTQTKYSVFINGNLLAEVPATWSKKPASNSCVYFSASLSCLASVSVWTDRITPSAVVAFSPNGDEVVLAISKQRSTYRVEPSYPCNGTERCANHGLEVQTMPSELVFIGTADGQIQTRQAGPTNNILQVGMSEDGQRLVLRQDFLTFNSTVTPEETFQTSTSFCEALYRTRSGSRLFYLPALTGVTNCYPQATFSS